MMLSWLFPLLCRRGKWDTGRWSNCSKIKLLRRVREIQKPGLCGTRVSLLWFYCTLSIWLNYSQLQFNISPSPLYVRPHVLLLFQKICLSFFKKRTHKARQYNVQVIHFIILSFEQNCLLLWTAPLYMKNVFWVKMISLCILSDESLNMISTCDRSNTIRNTRP